MIKLDGSAKIIICIFIVFIFQVYQAFYSHKDSLRTVCQSYYGLVDAINSEVKAGDYTKLGKIADIGSNDGEQHYHMLELEHKIDYECKDVWGKSTNLPSPQELRGS